MLKVVVTGSRDWTHRETIERELKDITRIHGSGVLAHGGAKGADTIAGEIAELLGWEVKVYKADWHEYRNAAGPIRNRQMLADMRPDVVVAFLSRERGWNKSKGTMNCAMTANEMGYRVLIIASPISPGRNNP